ncbi:MAG: phosphocholine-specific phospholipase C [Phyllobacterium sp.]
MDRRDFIKMLGLAGTSAAAYAACSAYMQQALADSTVIKDMLSADPHCKQGSLKDIEHVVILMQENRSFDHYYGTLRGVRGFGDPRPLKMRDGEPVWHQAQAFGVGQRIRPYHLPKGASADPDAGGVFLQDPLHGYGDGLGAWNNGMSDKWIANKDIVTMAHYVEEDIPLYFKLAKAFTLCDGYFCSHNGATDPNRSYFWTGTCNGRTGNGYFSSFNDSFRDDDPNRPDWKTYPEKLEDLGVAWKFYQDGLTWTLNPFEGNYGDNTLEFFKQYRSKTTVLHKKNQSVNSVLRTRADQESQFEKDVREDKLPAISWIVPPEAFTEHPKYPPHFGEYYLNEILRALIANKEVWHKTALLITYDENGGFFDHVLPPVPPLDANIGLASAGIRIPAKGVARDFDSERSVERDAPVGMGMRVPMLVISPWSTGGRVCSQVFDHTSVLRFLDTWLIAREKQPKDTPPFANISSWRQAVAGDLTSAFDFNRTKTGPMDGLADAIQPSIIYDDAKKGTAWLAPAYRPTVADVNADPAAKLPVAAKQDQTRCDILPVKYDFQVLGGFISKGGVERLNFTFRNAGELGAAFTVLAYDRTDGGWFYSVEGVKPGAAALEVSDSWDLNAQLAWGRAAGDYSYAIHGPNGYLAEFRGSSKEPTQRLLADIVEVKSLSEGKTIEFVFGKWPSANGRLRVVNAYTGYEAVVDSGAKSIDLTTQDGWYDIAFVDAVNSSRYLRRYAGHLENGRIGRSDPAIGLRYDETRRIYVAVTA